MSIETSRIDDGYEQATSHQHKVYDNKMDYIGEKAKCLAQLGVAFDSFTSIPAFDNWDMLITMMQRYQNITMNCHFEEVNA